LTLSAIIAVVMASRHTPPRNSHNSGSSFSRPGNSGFGGGGFGGGSRGGGGGGGSRGRGR